RIGGIAGKEPGDVLAAHDHRDMSIDVTGRRYENDPAVPGYRVRGGERAERGRIHLDQFGFQPDRPALRQAAGEHAPEAGRDRVVGAWTDDARMREMVEPAGMVVMEMGQHHNDVRWIDPHGEKAGTDLLVRCDLDRHLLEEGVPAREVTRRRVAPGVANVDQEMAFGMLDQIAEDRHRFDPVAVAEDVDLASDGAATLTADVLGGFHAGLPRFDCGYADHVRLLKERLFVL